MNKNVIIVIVLSVLIVMSAVQAIQLTKLKGDMSAGKISVASSVKPVSTSTGSSVTPSSLDQLDTMVGGC